MTDAQITPRMRHAVAWFLVLWAAVGIVNALALAWATIALLHPGREPVLHGLVGHYGVWQARGVVSGGLALLLACSAAVVVWYYRASVLPCLRPSDECSRCGYSLRGLRSRRCPECGASNGFDF